MNTIFDVFLALAWFGHCEVKLEGHKNGHIWLTVENIEGDMKTFEIHEPYNPSQVNTITKQIEEHLNVNP